MHRVIFATAGKAAETVAAFADDLTAHGANPDAIAEVWIDVSPAFIKGTADGLPNAAITFDKFHAVKIINDAVDPVRRTERKDHKLLVGTRYLWLRNPDRLSERQKVIFESLPMCHLKTTRAYRIRLASTSVRPPEVVSTHTKQQKPLGLGGEVLESYGQPRS